MESTTQKRRKKDPVDDQRLIALYMDSVVSNNMEPKNVYLFCKENAIQESDFYIHFGSIRALKEAIWIQFFDHAVATMQKDQAYATFSNRDKLLTLYFTLFELFTLNRSYILFQFEGHQNALKNGSTLKGMRSRFKEFIETMLDSTTDATCENNWAKVSKPVLAEGYWVNFLMVLKFWIEDTSKGFEKTDVLIEKSINTAMDLTHSQPLERLLDLGKFLWKENRN
jgi:hypothetical protein